MASRASMGLLKQAWHEIPDIVAGTGVAIVGLAMTGIGLWGYYSNDGDNRRYKLLYIVMRPDDPKADKIRKD